MRIFTAATEAIFKERPNRFVARVEIAGRSYEAHCPNPGSLLELLVPGARVILEESPDWKADPQRPSRRRTRYTLAAVYYRNRVVPLISSRANAVAHALVLPRLYPDALEIEREVSLGSSRFDFRIVTPDGPVFLEVKCCTLVEEGVALFPDAPTVRGRRHIEELGKIGTSETFRSKGAVLFMIMQPQARIFMPNIHTDPDFSAALVRLAGCRQAASRKDSRTERPLQVFASSVTTDRDGEVSLKEAFIPVDLATPQKHLKGGGSYLLVIELHQSVSLSPGSLPHSRFARGFYVYVGSAMNNLQSRINRHLRRQKTQHWHIDYLTPLASKIRAIPFRSARRLECALARKLESLSEHSCRGFGSSDCRCDSHLFFFEKPPLENRAFLDFMNRFRHREAFESDGGAD